MMSDDFTNFTHPDGSADDAGALSQNARAVYHRLLDEGAAWRTTPELARIGAQLRERANQLTLEHSVPAASAPTRLTARRPPSSPAHEASFRPRALPRRVSGWLGAAMAVLVVGALAALFLAAGPGRQGAGPVAKPSATSVHGRWVSLDSLAASVEFAANDTPAISPSDPRVVYESFARGIQQHLPATLRRTDDGGAHWQDLPIPVPAAHVGHAGFLVSPLDAHVVFLTLIDTQAEDCPPGTAQPMGETAGVLCWLQYSSIDGGAHWNATKLPAPGTLTPNLTNSSATALQAARGVDGQPRLYTLLNCPGAQTCSRLLVSADSGLSWRYADAPLLAAGATNVCATAADSQTTAAYAVTTAGKDCGWLTQRPLTLWRSDDAGARWTKVGVIPTPNLRGLWVAHDSATGKELLYAAAPRTTQMTTDKEGGKYPLFSADPSDLKVSADGGVSWTSAPSAGIPSSLKPYYDIGLLGVLSDGSVVVEYIPQAKQENFSGGVLFAWKPGAIAWRQLAPPLTSEAGALTPFVSSSTAPGADTLYLVMVDRSAGASQGTGPAPTPGAGDQQTAQSGSSQASHPTFTFLRFDP
jgi:hypothetical protein